MTTTQTDQRQGTALPTPGVPARAHIYQVYYDEKSRRACDPAFELYDNAGQCDVFFENRIISRLVPQSTAAYTGVLSWKFAYKTGKKGSRVLEYIEKDRDSPDVYCFRGTGRSSNVWLQAEQWHKGITEAGQMVFNALGYGDVDITRLKTPIIWQNHFIAATAVYRHYTDTILRPAMQWMQTSDNPALQQLLWADSGYMKRELRMSPALRERITAICGRPYYPMHPFICERFFSTYLALNDKLTLKSLK